MKAKFSVDIINILGLSVGKMHDFWLYNIYITGNSIYKRSQVWFNNVITTLFHCIKSKMLSEWTAKVGDQLPIAQGIVVIPVGLARMKGRLTVWEWRKI